MSNQGATHIDEGLVDPSLRDGGEILFNKEIPLEVRSCEASESELLLVRFKIIAIGQDGQLAQVRLEISSDADVFFMLESQYTAEDFSKLQQAQQLTIPFEDFPKTLIELVVQNASDPDEFQLVFTRDSETHGVLDFKQQLKFKSVDIFSLEFVPSSDEYVNDQIQYRFNVLRDELKVQ